MGEISRNGLRRRAGSTLVTSIFVLVALMALASLAVDLGAVHLFRNEAQHAVDAAARDAAFGLRTSVSTARARAVESARKNLVAGDELVLNSSQDIQFGLWDPQTRQFEVLTGSDQVSATAVRVIGRRTKSRGSAAQMHFARIVGLNEMDITVEAIASRGQIIRPKVNGLACPWLAGMPNGSRVDAYDGNNTDAVAPQCSPELVEGLPLIPGTAVSFRQTTGTTSYVNASNYGPDGQTDWIVRQRADNGINATRAPIMSLVGIFLDNRRPNTYGMQPELDFSTNSSRNFSELRPKLKQVFFIGDGLNSNGELQRFIVPEGATRFYLGIMDEKGWWWDNTGDLNTTTLDENVKLVK